MRVLTRVVWATPYKALGALAGLGLASITEPGHLVHQGTAAAAVALLAAVDGAYLWARSRAARVGEA